MRDVHRVAVPLFVFFLRAIQHRRRVRQLRQPRFPSELFTLRLRLTFTFTAPAALRSLAARLGDLSGASTPLTASWLSVILWPLMGSL